MSLTTGRPNVSIANHILAVLAIMARDTLGEFEQLVLLACLRLDDSAFTVPILQEIRDRTGRDASHAAVYIALQRLEKKRLLTTNEVADPPPVAGRSRIRYVVTDAAVQLLREQRDALLSMWAGLEPVEQ